MPKFGDALRGYAFEIMKRDGFRCRYCGLDGTESFANWLTLSWDHLFPKGHPDRDNPEYIVCACNFCNCADNWYFINAESRGLIFEGRTAEELVQQRLPYVLNTRQNYREFWDSQVSDSNGKGSL